MLQPLSSVNRVMMVGLSSKSLSLIDVSVLARWNIRPRLMGVPGVANVAIWGQRDRQLQVRVDPSRLHDAGVPLNQVIRTAGNALWVSPLTFLEASSPGSGGFIDTNNQRIGIQHLLPINSPEDLARVTLEGCPQSGPAPKATTTPTTTACTNPLRIGDIATVVEDHQPLIGDAVLPDGPSLMLVIEKLPEANVVDVTRGLEDALRDLAPGLTGVTVDPAVYRSANYVDQSTDNLRTPFLVGVGLLVVSLLLLSFGWRRTLVTVTSVATSFTAAAVVLALLGSTINLMVVAGLVLAIVALVDDASGDAELIEQRLREHSGDGERAARSSIVREAALSRRGPLLYATAIMLTALVPFAVLEGEANAFLPPLVLAYTAAVLASLVVALTVTPAIAVLVLRGAGSRQPPFVRWLMPAYDRLVQILTQGPKIALALLAYLVILCLTVAPQLDRTSTIMPPLQDPNVLVRWEGAPGTSLPEMERVTARAAVELRMLRGIKSVGVHVGRAVMSDAVTNANAAEMWVSIDPAVDYDTTVKSLEEVIRGYPGFAQAVMTLPHRRIAEVLTDKEADVTVRIFGPDLAVLSAKANEVQQMVSGVAGVASSRTDSLTEEPTIDVTVNLDNAQRAGVKPGDVRRAAATLLSGIEVGSLFKDQKVFEVVVWGAPAIRGNVDSVRELLIDTPSGTPVRLGDVADVRIAPSPTVITHDAVSRSVEIEAHVSGRDVNAVTRDIQQGLRGIQFPLEHHADVHSLAGHEQSQQRRLLAIVAAVSLVILLILQAAFGSWRLAGLAFLTLPAAVSGAVLAALIDGDPVSIGTIAGLFAVFTLGVRNAVTSIRRWQRLHSESAESSIDIARRGAHEQLSALITTGVLVALALLPLVIAGNRAGAEVLRPMAAVVLGGLVTTTVVAAFVLPALYARWGSPPASDSAEGIHDAVL
jgi:Cu/Ag efflux pump CusA